MGEKRGPEMPVLQGSASLWMVRQNARLLELGGRKQSRPTYSSHERLMTMVEVTQFVRDVAARIYEGTTGGYGDNYKNGSLDHGALVQNLAALSQAAIAEGRRQMREEAADIAGAIDSGRGNEAEIARAIRAIPIGDE